MTVIVATTCTASCPRSRSHQRAHGAANPALKPSMGNKIEQQKLLTSKYCLYLMQLRKKQILLFVGYSITVLHSMCRKLISKLVKFSGWSNPLELHSDHFPSWLCQPGGINKDPIV